MNFFEHQQQARASSRRLTMLFALAVLATVVAVNLVLAGLYLQIAAPAGMWLQHHWGALPNGFFVTTTLVVLLLIGGGSWLEMSRLAGGGAAVAQMVGARLLEPGTHDLLERRLLNVVEEMALAAGTPVPRVYIMDDENGINAFAAGQAIHDAVITVTRGALTRLSRDELQGVIGHEFSHILNGDMTLNLRLIGVLAGLLLIAMFGRFLLQMGRGGRSERGGNGLVLAAIALWVVGFVGVFFGRLIKAGVSRQREFLADASSVQFTRNPDGIGGALRKIGGAAHDGEPGSQVEHRHAETLSHMFLGAGRANFASGWLATHPPLSERIRRVYGRPMDMLPAPGQSFALAAGAPATQEEIAAPELAPLEFSLGEQTPSSVRTPATASASNTASAATLAALRGQPVAAVLRSPVAGLAAIAASPGSAHGLAQRIGAAALGAGAIQRAPNSGLTGDGKLATAAPEADELPPVLRDALGDSTRAPLFALALLIEKGEPMSDEQRRLIAETYGAPAAQAVDAYRELIQPLPPGGRLPLLDRAMPALRKLPPPTCDRLLLLAHGMIVADGRITLPEFLLFTVLQRRLGPGARRATPVRFARVAECANDAALVLSLLAQVRLPQAPDRAYNAGASSLPGFAVPRVFGAAIALADVAVALDRLNQLAPLAKPAFIKA